MRRIERDAREDSIVIQLEDGSTQVFPESESLLLEFLVSHWEAGIAEDAGEEYEWEGEIGRLHKALERATDESREEFYAQYYAVCRLGRRGPHEECRC